jgi:hypothetical protein
MNIQTLWNDETTPIFEGVVEKTGFMYPLNSFPLVRGGSTTTLKDFLISHPNRIAGLTPIASCLSADQKWEVVCGEGSWGGDGFIAMLSAENDELEWIYFSQATNPVISVKFEPGKIVSKSSLGKSYIISLDEKNYPIAILESD